jgi:hypothetical protein
LDFPGEEGEQDRGVQGQQHHGGLPRRARSGPVSAPEAKPCQLGDQPAPPDPKLGPHPPDRPALLDMAALQVAGQILEAQLGQPLGAARLPGGRLRPPAPLPSGYFSCGPPGAPDAVLLHEPPHRHPVGAKLGGDLGQQPPRTSSRSARYASRSPKPSWAAWAASRWSVAWRG